ncbi:MAG TPA: TrkA family potassium uptake protein [Myxococcota bacterium]|nr:TrkA family potassium uptake protein [Myxococcota bacterium]
MAQFAVVGLGNFGHYLAINLSKKGHEVMAIDSVPERVENIKDDVSQAVVADATDQEALRSLGVHQMDAAVVCIGSDIGQSILATLNLKELGLKRVQTMAIGEAHERVLQKLGVTGIYFPERDLAVSVAEKLHNPNMLEYLPVVEGYGIIELSPPEEFIGKSLKDLDLTNRFGVQVVAIKESVPDHLDLIPKAAFKIKESDLLIMLGPSDFLDKLKKKGNQR